MKRKLVVILLSLVLVLSLTACDKSGNSSVSGTSVEPSVSSVTSVSAEPVEPSVTSASTEPVEPSVVSTSSEPDGPEIYGPDGEMYVEYTLDYYLENAFEGNEENYNLEYFQYVSPFVGRWLNCDGSGEGYYFYSDEYLTYAYADGAIEPFAWECYLDESNGLVDRVTMNMFSIKDGVLSDTEGNTYMYSGIEFPYDVADSSFYGFWQYDSDPNFYVQISREGEIIKVHNSDGDRTGYFEMTNPYTMYLLDEDGNRMYRFSMTEYGHAAIDGEETLHYYEDVPKG